MLPILLKLNCVNIYAFLKYISKHNIVALNNILPENALFLVMQLLVPITI